MTDLPRLQKWRDPLLVAGITLAGLCLRLYSSEHRGFWKDEAEFFFTCFTNLRLRQNAPLTIFVHRETMELLGAATSFTLRLPSIFFGTLLIPAVFVLGRLLAGRAVAFLAAVLTVLSPMALYYAQEGRPYAMFQFISALVLIAFVRAYEKMNNGWWIAYSVLLMLGGLTHMLILHLAAGLAFFIGWDAWQRRDENTVARVASFMIATAVGLAIGLCWIVPRERAVVSVLNGVYPRSLIFFLETALSSLGPYFACGRIPLSIGGFIASVIVLLFSIAGAIRLRNQKLRSIALLAPSLFGTTLLAHWYTLGGKGWWFWPRYLSHLLPLYLVLVAIGWESLHRSRRLRLIGLATLALTFVPGTVDWAQKLTWDRSWKVQADELLVRGAGSQISGVILSETVGSPDFMVTPTWGLQARGKTPTYFIYRRGEIVTTRWLDLNAPAPPVLLVDTRTTLANGAYAIISVDPEEPSPGCKAFVKAKDYECVEDRRTSAATGLRVVRLRRAA